MHQPDNPFDEEALAVSTVEPLSLLGYIPRSCFVRDVVHERGLTCALRIKAIGEGGSGHLGVVVEAAVIPRECPVMPEGLFR